MLDRLQALIKAEEALILLAVECQGGEPFLDLDAVRCGLRPIIAHYSAEFDKAKAAMGDDA